MKKFPLDSIKIGGHIWKIKLTPFTSPQYKRKLKKARCKNAKVQETFVFGLTTWGDSTIRINSTLDYQMMMETLLHEIYHILLDEVEKLKPKCKVHEEPLVQSLAFLTYTMFKDNPKLAGALTKE